MKCCMADFTHPVFCTICDKEGVVDHTHCDSSHQILTLENIKVRSDSEPELSEIIESLKKVSLGGPNGYKERSHSAPTLRVRFDSNED